MFKLHLSLIIRNIFTMRLFLRTPAMLLALLLLILCVTVGESRGIEEENRFRPFDNQYNNYLVQTFVDAFENSLDKLHGSVSNNGKLFAKYAVRSMNRGVNEEEEEAVKNGIRTFEPLQGMLVLAFANALYVVLTNLWRIISANGIFDLKKLFYLLGTYKDQIWNFIVTIVPSIFGNLRENSRIRIF